MGTWQGVAEENLASAKVLFREGHFRGALNRAYYAAYAAATGRLAADGISFSGRFRRPNPDHSQLASMLEHNLDRARFTGAARRAISSRIRTLRRFREVADYEPRESIQRGTVIDCIRDAVFVTDSLRS